MAVARSVVKLRRKLRQVHAGTLISLYAKNRFSGRVKIGFGPIRSGESDLNVRKWRIDPIVNYINRNSKEYVADFFFPGDDLERFQIIVLVKAYSDELMTQLMRLRNRIVVYDVVDNPLGCKRSIYEDFEFAKSLSGLIVSSPAQAGALLTVGVPHTLIEHPVINTCYKASYVESNPVVLVWQGFSHNMGGAKRLEALIRDMAGGMPGRLRFVYHTNAEAADDGVVHVIPWSKHNAFSVLAASDIAISVRDDVRPWQAEKPSTKAIAFMAAGLPVVCSPTLAERLVIEHGVTGYLVHNDDEWRECLTRLILDAALREKMGRAARRYAMDNFSVARIAQKYLAFFAQLRK